MSIMRDDGQMFSPGQEDVSAFNHTYYVRVIPRGSGYTSYSVSFSN